MTTVTAAWPLCGATTRQRPGVHHPLRLSAAGPLEDAVADHEVEFLRHLPRDVLLERDARVVDEFVREVDDDGQLFQLEVQLAECGLRLRNRRAFTRPVRLQTAGPLPGGTARFVEPREGHVVADDRVVVGAIEEVVLVDLLEDGRRVFGQDGKAAVGPDGFRHALNRLGHAGDGGVGLGVLLLPARRLPVAKAVLEKRPERTGPAAAGEPPPRGKLLVAGRVRRHQVAGALAPLDDDRLVLFAQPLAETHTVAMGKHGLIQVGNALADVADAGPDFRHDVFFIAVGSVGSHACLSRVT